MKTYYRTVMVSDSHLCTRDCQDERLREFLRGVKCDHLYIVGDFFDFWQLKRRWVWLPNYNALIQRIIKMAKRGTKVTYVPGNHDEAFREYVGHNFGGVDIALNASHSTADGRTFFVTHGDEFDAVVKYNKWLAHLGGIAYDYLLSANTATNYFRTLFGLERWSLAAMAKRRIKNASVYIDRYEAAVVAEGERRKVDGVICGHVHTPKIKMLNNLIYCNTGDWVDSCTALVENAEGKLKVIREDHSVLFEEVGHTV